MTVYNNDTKNVLWIDDVVSGGIGNNILRNNSEHAPFGVYDILNTTREGKLYQRLEALDNKYGDDIVNFKGQTEHSLIRLHYAGSGLTWGCIAVADEQAKEILAEMDNTTTRTVLVNSKYGNAILRLLFPKEPQTKYGELRVVDLTTLKLP
jgi:hypothetical protein